MLILPGLAMMLQLLHGPTAWLTGEQPNYLLAAFALATLALEVWIILEGVKAWRRTPPAERDYEL
jgi:hypothetical protein